MRAWRPNKHFLFLISLPEMKRSLWLLSADRSLEERSPLGVSESSPRSKLSQFSEVKGRISRSKSKYFFLQQTLR